MLTEEAGIEYDNAMHTINNSEIYEKLMDAETGLYREALHMCMGCCRMRSTLDTLFRQRYDYDIGRSVNVVTKYLRKQINGWYR